MSVYTQELHIVTPFPGDPISKLELLIHNFIENKRQQNSNASKVDLVPFVSPTPPSPLPIRALFVPGKLTNPLDSLRGGTKTLLKTFLQTSRFCLRLPLYVFRLACLVPRATHTWTLLETKILINPLVSLRGGTRALSIPECLIVLHRFYGFSRSGFARCQEVGGSGVSLLIYIYIYIYI